MRNLVALFLLLMLPLCGHAQVTISGRMVIDSQTNETTSAVCNLNVECSPPLIQAPPKISSTIFYAGLVWELGDIKNQHSPLIVFGIRNTKGKRSDHLNGIDFNIRFLTSKNMTIESKRLTILDGKPKALVQIGAGYSYLNSSVIGTGSLQLLHIRLSSDYIFNGGNFKLYSEVNTLPKPKSGNTTTIRCTEGLNLADSTELNAGSNQTLDGRTCFKLLPR
jgi:hypothetical protein